MHLSTPHFGSFGTNKDKKKFMGVWHIIECSSSKIAQKYIFYLQNWFCLPRSHWFNYPFRVLCLFMRLPCSSHLWVKTRCFLQICGSLSGCHRNVRWLPDRNSTKEGTYVQWIHYHLVNSTKWPTRVQWQTDDWLPDIFIYNPNHDHWNSSLPYLHNLSLVMLECKKISL